MSIGRLPLASATERKRARTSSSHEPSGTRARRPARLPGALSDVADIYLESAEFDRDDPRASIRSIARRSRLPITRGARSKDFAVAFRQVSALEGLATALEKAGPARGQSPSTPARRTVDEVGCPSARIVVHSDQASRSHQRCRALKRPPVDPCCIVFLELHDRWQAGRYPVQLL